jgi:hypothetical protein
VSENEHENENEEKAGKNILDLLKADYSEIVSQKDVYIPIVGWEKSGLAIRYRLPESGKELDAIQRRVNQQYDKKERYDRGFFTAVDTMIRLCEGLYVKHPEDPSVWVELDPKETGRPLDLGDGEELSPILGWNGAPASARDVVKRLFGNNEMAILAHSEKLQRWMMDTNADLSTELWQVTFE